MSLKEKMIALADAVREKAELTDTLTIDEMTEAVNGLVVNGVDVDERTLTVTPSESQQNFTSSDLGENAYYGTVTVNAIPDEYITTTDATAVSSDILEGTTAYVNGKKVTGSMTDMGALKIEMSPDNSYYYNPGGYVSILQIYAHSESKKFTPSTELQTYTATEKFINSVTVDPIPAEYITTTDATALSGDILEGKTAYALGEKVTGTIPSVTASIVDNVVTIPQGYNPEARTITVGTAKEAETYTPGTSDITIQADTYLSGEQVIKGDSALIPENIKTGVSIFNVSGSFTSDADATSSDIASGKTAYVKGEKITGTAAGGESFYKCTSIEGPQILTFVSVTGAGISDCNGNYSDSGISKSGQPVYIYASASGTTWYIYYTTSAWEGDSWVLSDSLDVEYSYGAHYYSSQLSGTWWGGEGGGEEAGQATVSLEYNPVNTGQERLWSGYKLIASETGYSLAEELTTGLTYAVGASSDYVNDCIMPKVGGIYNSDCTTEICDVQFKTDDALTFTAEEAFSSVGLHAPYPHNVDVSGVMYSTDGKTWEAYPINTRIDLLNVGDFVKFKNTKNVLTITGTGASFSLTGKIAASGELKSMINYLEDWPNACFSYLFRNQNALTSCPDISCNKLGSGSLNCTFNGCQNVKKVKIRINELLPATDGSYYGIDGTFGGCKSLTVVEVDLNSWLGFDTLNGWLQYVSPKGVFIKPAELPEEYGEKRIPEGWVVVNK